MQIKVIRAYDDEGGEVDDKFEGNDADDGDEDDQGEESSCAGTFLQDSQKYPLRTVQHR